MPIRRDIRFSFAGTRPQASPAARAWPIAKALMRRGMFAEARAIACLRAAKDGSTLRLYLITISQSGNCTGGT